MHIPLHWRGVGVGCPEPEGPTPKAAAFCPSRKGIFTGVPMNCWKCRTEIEIAASAKVLKTDSCPKCDYDLHVCLNCRFYDPSAHNQCRETQAEWVRDKEKANYCDYFEPRSLSGLSHKGGNAATDAKSAFDKLFKK